ncbi:hypothetical protein N9153_01020 [Planctomicrobium sp.]|nr:hypothetical protein [Planctomicrobium sp.]
MTSEMFVVLGIVQLGVLFASALVPFQLSWKEDLAVLPKLHRQLFYVYGAYVVLGIVTLGATCIIAANDLTQESILAKAFCTYGLLFWGIRLALQTILDAKPFLTTKLLLIGYHALTVAFLISTLMYGIAVFN